MVIVEDSGNEETKNYERERYIGERQDIESLDIVIIIHHWRRIQISDPKCPPIADHQNQ